MPSHSTPGLLCAALMDAGINLQVCHRLLTKLNGPVGPRHPPSPSTEAMAAFAGKSGIDIGENWHGVLAKHARSSLKKLRAALKSNTGQPDAHRYTCHGVQRSIQHHIGSTVSITSDDWHSIVPCCSAMQMTRTLQAPAFRAITRCMQLLPLSHSCMYQEPLRVVHADCVLTSTSYNAWPTSPHHPSCTHRPRRS